MASLARTLVNAATALNLLEEYQIAGGRMLDRVRGIILARTAALI